MSDKISKVEIAKFIRDQELLKLEDRVRIIEIVSNYFKNRVDGNDVNKVLIDDFGR